MAYTDGEYYFDTHRNNITAAAKGNGVVSGMGVTEAATPAKTVVVGTGVYVANGTSVTKSSATTIDLSSHISATNPNKVIITADSAGSITATAGTAAVADPAGSTGPQTKVPLLPNLPANEIMLAEVWLAAAETTILNADITDRREYIIERVNLAGAQTVAGVKTFSSFPVTPSSAPTTDYQVANKKYVDAGGFEIYVPFLFASGPVVSYPVAVGGSLQAIGYDLDAGAEYVRGTCVIPNSFGTLVGAMIELDGGPTGTIDWTVTTHWGGLGESFTNDTDTVTEDGKVITNTLVAQVDFSAALTGIAANDLLNVRFTLDTLTTVTHIYVAGFRLYYTP
uniref:Uncharacterized protein n=1 Tax=viral metagenome TaxID=1070528 RepID=A0A6M3JW60_9ZZZZ